MPSSNAATTTPVPSRSILVVDDNDDVREAIIAALRVAGYDAVGAENGAVALARLRDEGLRPGLILLDLMMPEMDGFEFMDELRGRPDWQDIPVVVITAKDLTRTATASTAASSVLFKRATATKCCVNSPAR